MGVDHVGVGTTNREVKEQGMIKCRRICVALVLVLSWMSASGVAKATETITIAPRSVAMTSAGGLTFANDIVSYICDIAMTATFQSSVDLSLTAGLTLVGGVTSGSMSNCDGVQEALMLGLSPNLTRVDGTWDIAVLLPLPDPLNGQANIRILDVRMLFDFVSAACLYQGNLLATLNPAGTRLSFAGANNNLAVDAAHSDPICSFIGNQVWAGEIDVEGHDDGSAVRVTLRRA